MTSGEEKGIPRRLPADAGDGRETLEPDFDVMDKYERREKREALEAWVGDIGPDACHKLIDQIWDKR